jgi:hypothetical protein
MIVCRDCEKITGGLCWKHNPIKTFRYPDNYTFEIQEPKNENYICKCGKKYGTKQGLLTHQRMRKHLNKSL